MFKLDAKSNKVNYKYKTEKTVIIQLNLVIAYLINLLGLTNFFECKLKSIIAKLDLNPEVREQLSELKPDFILISNPYWFEEPLVAYEANKLNIPVISLVPSWDNVTTKTRPMYKSDYYLVWSEVRKQEVIKYYKNIKPENIFIYGTPQYDIFKNKNYIIPKEVFFNKYNLNLNKPLILFTLGSPLFIKSEIDVCYLFCLKSKEKNLLDKYQILVRPHPIKDFTEWIPQFKNISEEIIIQEDVQTKSDVLYRFQSSDMIKNWISTFYYCDLVIKTGSTTFLDGSMFNKPHINISANLSEDKSLDNFLDDFSNKFEHFKSLNENKLLNNVYTWNELFKNVLEFISNPNTYTNKSKEIVLHLSGSENKGLYGKQLADNIKIITQRLNNESKK